MRIGRVILTAGARPWGDAKGDAFNRWVWDVEVGDEDQAHLRRVRAALEAAAEQACDVLIFPACTFVVATPGISMRRWLNLAGNHVPLVLGGGLTLDKQGVRYEFLFVSLGGGAARGGWEPSARVRLLPAARPGAAAISSSVGYVRDAPAAFLPAMGCATRTKPLLIADMGHGQYSGQYVKLLKSILTACHDGGAESTFLAVAMWRKPTTPDGSLWALSGSRRKPWALHNEGKPHVVSLDIESEGRPRPDRLDIFDV